MDSFNGNKRAARRRAMLASMWLGAFVFWPVRPAQSLTGLLDPRFGDAGIAAVNVSKGAGYGDGHAVAITGDGKIVVAGRGDGDFELVRYHPDGSIDTSFGDEGHVRTDFGGTPDAAFAVVAHPDGRIVAAGWADNRVAVARYNVDGSLDTSFGEGGKVTTLAQAASYGYAAVLQPDGKLVVGGKSCNPGSCNFLLVRYSADGSLDASFGGDGLVETPAGDGNSVGVQGLSLQADGKLVVAGSTGSTPDSDFALARYDTDGSLDSTFGGTGVVVTSISSGNDAALALVIQPDGKAVAAGWSCDPTCAPAVVRYHADGSLDDDFDGDGVATVSAPANLVTYALALQADGKLLVAGSVPDGPGTAFALVRFDVDGSVDATYDGDGVVSTAVGGDSSSARAVVVQGDGKAVAAGWVGASQGFALARYDTDGSLDGSFGGGTIVTGVGLSGDLVNAVVTQPDGKTVAAGQSYDYARSDGDFVVARFDQNGSLDATFGGDGIEITDIDDYDEARALALQADGKLVVAGSAGHQTAFALVRYGPDGSLDGSFGTGGKVTLDVGGFNQSANAVAVQSDGKIVVAGSSSTGSSDIHLARFGADGSLDATFGGTGHVVTDTGSGEFAAAMAIQADGRIVVAGQINGGPTQSDFALLRYNPDGTLDTSFDGDGIVLTDFGGAVDQIRSLALQGDGRILVAGYHFDHLTKGALARYDADGSLDATFGAGGKVVTSLPEFTSLALDGDGRILVTSGLSVARFRPDGSTDTSFGDPLGSVPLGIGLMTAHRAIAIDASGDIIVGGMALSGNADLAVARLITGCSASPALCRTAEKNTLLVKNVFPSSRFRLTWKWILGQSTAQAEIDDPTADAVYSMCFYAGGELLRGLVIPPASARWTRLGSQQNKGLRYLDRSATVDGVKRMLVRTSSDDRSRIIVKGTGANLPEFFLPFSLPVEVQLQNSETGVCWGSTFTSAERNDTTHFQARP